MDDFCTYHIEVLGPLAEADIENFCPTGLMIETVGAGNTLLSFRADQSGMIGMIRQLHGLGFILLSIQCLVPDAARASAE